MGYGLTKNGIYPTAHKYLCNSRNIHYRQKLWNIFQFSNFCVFYGVCRVFLYLICISTSRCYFWEVNSHSIAKWTAKVQEQLLWSYFFIRRWLEFLLSHCQIAAISVRAFLEISCTISLLIYHLAWCDRQGTSIVVISHRRTDGGSSLGIPQDGVHKGLTRQKQQIVSYRIEEVVNLKSLPL